MKKLLLVLNLALIAMSLVSCEFEEEDSIGVVPASVVRDLPEIGVIKKVKLEVRDNDNYERSCLYLTNYDRGLNNCMILLQNDESLYSNLKGSDIGLFFHLMEGANHVVNEETLGAELSSSIKSGLYQVGDEFFLKKSDRDLNVRMTIKVLEIEAGSHVVLEYKVLKYMER